MAEHDKLCGELIIDFVKAKTSDEAGLKFIANVQKLFKFPPQFTPEAQNKFPQLEKYFKVLSPTDKELFDLFINEIESLKSIEQCSGSIDFLGYDDDLENYKYGEYRTLLFDNLDIPSDYDGDEDRYETIDLVKSQKTNRKNLEILYYVGHNDLYISDEASNKMCADFVNAIFKHIEIGNKMLELLKVKKTVSIEKYRKIEKMAYHFYNNIRLEHKHIDEIRNDFKNYLNSILQNGLENKKILQSFLFVYNENISKLILSKEGNIESNNFCIEQNILLNRDYEKSDALIFLDFNCNCIYHKIIAYSLVRFLKNEKNKLKFKKCPYCQNFFIATDIKRKRCYEESCSREYEKEKKRKQREDDPVTYL